VQRFEDAWRVTGWYERRWVVEEYHKAQKTGCRIEDMQFTTPTGWTSDRVAVGRGRDTPEPA